MCRGPHYITRNKTKIDISEMKKIFKDCEILLTSVKNKKYCIYEVDDEND